MTAWTLHSDLATRKVTVLLTDAPDLPHGAGTSRVTLRPTSATWYVVPWGTGTRIGNVLIQGDIVRGKDSKSGGSMIVTLPAEEQPGWLADIQTEAIP